MRRDVDRIVPYRRQHNSSGRTIVRSVRIIQWNCWVEYAVLSSSSSLLGLLLLLLLLLYRLIRTAVSVDESDDEVDVSIRTAAPVDQADDEADDEADVPIRTAAPLVDEAVAAVSCR